MKKENPIKTFLATDPFRTGSFKTGSFKTGSFKTGSFKTGCSLTALLLTLSLLLCMGTACANTQDPETTTALPDAAVTTVDPDAGKYDADGYLKDSLPEQTNLNTTLVMLYWSDVENVEFFVEESGIGAVEDSIKRRNEKVEHRLGVKIDYQGTPGDAGDRANYIAKIRAAYNSGNTYDIYAGYTLAMATAATSGFCSNLLDYECLDFTAPWWPEKLIAEATVNNKLFFATGDLSTNLLYMMYVMYFNKDIMTQFGVENPYDCMESNTWTYEKMFEMAHAVDGRQDGANPLYGFVANTMHTDPFFYGAELRTLDRDADGTPVISELFNSERTQKVAELVAGFLADPICDVGSKCNSEFQSGQAMFIMSRARLASRDLGDVSFKYGIAPIPKFTADQTTYSTCLGFPCSFYAVSGAAPHPEEAAMTLECLSSEGYRIITPILFEVTMKTRYTTDPIAAKTFDLARAGVSFDLGRIYSDALNNLTYTIFRTCIVKNQPNFSVSYKVNEGILKAKLQSMIEAFK